MRVALYIRVSTEEQVKEGYSIAAQKDRLSAYALSQDWSVMEMYVDEGISAKDMERPELQRMLEDARNKLFDIVLVYRLDRLTRSVLDLYKLLQTFDDCGVKFKSATEVYDTTTAMGRLFITLVAALAQWERENLGERVKMGMEQRAKEGKWHGSSSPFGYNYNNDVFTINEKEAALVKRMFNLYIGGNGDNSVATALNQEGIMTRAGKKWWGHQVAYILQNPIYIGNLRWNTKNKERYFTVENAAPAIIDNNTFNQALQLRKVRNQGHPREATSRYIFTGRLRCARCGNKFKGHTKITGVGRYYTYHCQGKRNGMCDLPGISERILEDNFMEYLQNLSIDSALEVAKDHTSVDRTDELQELERELKKIKARRKKWQLAWVEELISQEEFSERMREDQEREKSLQEEIKRLQTEGDHTQFTSEEIDTILSNLIALWGTASQEEKKTSLQLLINEMTIDIMPKANKSHKGRVIFKDISFN